MDCCGRLRCALSAEATASVTSPSAQVGFTERLMRVNLVVRDVQRLQSLLDRLFVPPGADQVAHQYATPLNAQRVLFYDPPHLRRRFLKAAEGAQVQAGVGPMSLG